MGDRMAKYWLADGREISDICQGIRPGKVISFVGGGGKTSTMLSLGQELSRAKKRVIMTTTTRILPFSSEDLNVSLSCVGSFQENGKLGPVKEPEKLPALCDHLLVEADGSRGLPIKAPKDHEPVIMPSSDQVIALMGLTGIGKPIERVCHRVEEVCAILGKEPVDRIEIEDAIRLLLDPHGLSKCVGNRRFAVVLNQADDKELLQYGMAIAAGLPPEIECIISNYQKP